MAFHLQPVSNGKLFQSTREERERVVSINYDVLAVPSVTESCNFNDEFLASP